MRLREALDCSRTDSAQIVSGGVRVCMLMEIPANPDPGKVNYVWYSLNASAEWAEAAWADLAANDVIWPSWYQLPAVFHDREDWQPMFPKHSLERLVEGIEADAGKSEP